MSDALVSEKSTHNKSFFKSKWIIVASILLGVILLGAAIIGLSVIVPKNITGAWELVVNPEVKVATEDEIPETEKVCYVFDKPDRYGRGDIRLCYQGGVENLNYELLQEDGVNKVNLGALDMEYTITGSKLLGNAELTLIYPEYTDEETGETYEAQKYIFAQTKDPRYEKESYKDFKLDSSIIGEKYISNQRALPYFYYEIPYVETIEFTKDGVMIINYQSDELFINRNMYYAYSAENSQLTFSSVLDKETKYTVAYELDSEGNLKFAGDTTTDSIFGDAFFGDYIFYTAENLPEPSVSAETQRDLTE